MYFFIKISDWKIPPFLRQATVHLRKMLQGPLPLMRWAELPFCNKAEAGIRRGEVANGTRC